MPKTSPTAAEATKANIDQYNDMVAGSDGNTAGTIVVMSAPSKSPITPPTAVSMTASSVNCTRMSRLRAPMALRTPISRVRSVTETRDRKHEDEDHARDLIPHVGKRILSEDCEVVWLLGRDLPAAAQQLAHFVHCFGHVSMRGGFDADPVLLQLWMQLPERAQRKEHDVVIGILSSAEHALPNLRHTDHGKQLPLNVKLFAQRLLTREKLLRGIVANDNGRGAALFIDIAEPAAGVQRDVNDVFVRGGVAFQNSLFGLAIFVFDGVGASTEFRPEKTHANGDRFHVRQILHRHGVIEGQFLAGAHLFRRTSEGEGLQVESENNIGAQAADDLTYVVV